MSVLIKPLVTEKVTAGNDKGVFGFVVDVKANKVAIKQEIEKMYGVNVVAVRTSILPGKPKTRYTKRNIMAGRSAKIKKAFVTLADGEVIDFYSEL